MYRDSGREYGNYYSGFGVQGLVAGIYKDNGKENGNSDNGFYRGYIGVKVGDCRIRFSG